MDSRTDFLLHHWPRVKDQVQQHWNKVTAEDLGRLSGRTEELAVVLQEHYGYSKPQAVMEIFKWLQDLLPSGAATDLERAAQE